MLSRNYEFYLVITNYWPYGLPYGRTQNSLRNKSLFCGKTDPGIKVK